MNHDCNKCEQNGGLCSRHPDIMKVGRLLELCRGDAGEQLQTQYVSLWDSQHGLPGSAPLPESAPPPPLRNENPEACEKRGEHLGNCKG